jgi:GNAT superfamily N-acetyltransferase
VNRTQLAPQGTRAGGSIRIRPADAADCAAISLFVAGLSARARFLRFFGPASPPSSSVLRGMCGAGLTTDVLVATDDQADSGAVIGHAMAADSIAPDGSRVTDVGLVVADRWQHHGVGSDLLSRLVARAEARGVSALVMDVLPENRPMLTMISRKWPGAAFAFAPDAVTVRVSLATATSANGGRGGAVLRAA